MSNNKKLNTSKIEEAKQILNNNEFCTVVFTSACGKKNVEFKITKDANTNMVNIQMDSEPHINDTLRGQVYCDYAVHFLKTIQGGK